MSYNIPTVTLGHSLKVHRIIHGCWQLSGGWGNINVQPGGTAHQTMLQLAKQGYSSFDGADHYGASEDLFGVLKQDGFPLEMFTKWCPGPGPMPRSVVENAIGKSLRRMRTDALDLLQFHWWDYNHKNEMLTALGHLSDMQREGKIKNLGLTNFDTAHVQMFVEHGLPIVSNQVQFSVVDTRPTRKMGPYCAAHHIKLLTYGSMMGGLLNERWMNRPPPQSKAELPTPSLGKYFRMLQQWGSWELFQELLKTLHTIAKRHHQEFTIGNVATQWVLQQAGVGAVIIGFRPGYSDHAASNARIFGQDGGPAALVLSAADLALIQAVQAKSNDLLEVIGDCGDEYRG